MTISNEILPSAFVSNEAIQVMPFSSPPVQLKWETSLDIKLVVHKPGKRLSLGKLSTLTVLTLPRESEIEGWRLKATLTVQLRPTRKELLSMTWLEGIAEYGTGKGESEAIADLVVSLGECRESLEKRESDLGDSALKELDHLRKLIERAPQLI